LTEDRAAMRTATGAPPEARFASRLILRRPDDRRVEIWQYRNSDRRIVGSRVERDVAYDPRADMVSDGDGRRRRDPHGFPTRLPARGTWA
jgi:hypothetical protein